MAQTLEDMDEVVALREEPQPRLHDPVHARGRAAQLHARLHRPAATTAAARRPLNLIVEVIGRAARRTRPPRSTPPARSGCRRSTTTAASAAGPSSRSPTRGTPRTRSAAHLKTSATADSSGGSTTCRARRKATGADARRGDPPPGQARQHPDRRAARLRRDGDEAARQTMLYPRDPSLDPQLVWKGKDEQDRQDLEVPVVPIYIQEKIHPQAIIENLRDTARKGEPEPELDALRRLRRPRRSRSWSTSTSTSRTGRTA